MAHRDVLPIAGALSETARLRQRIEDWRQDAAVLHRRGVTDRANLLEQCAREVEEDMTSDAVASELLTIEEAATETGYSASGIRKLLARNKVANAGKTYAPRIRRGDLKGLKRNAKESRAG